MNKLLQLSTYGIKNIESEVTINFSNETIEKGISKINNVKGIFGYNGAGKSAIMGSVDFYKNIVCNQTFLMQNETKQQLNKLINYKRKEFFISMIYEYKNNIVIKHCIKLNKSDISTDYIISEESIMLSSGRTLSEKYKTIIAKTKNDLYINPCFSVPNDFLVNVDLEYTSIIQQVVKKMALNKSSNKATIDFSDLEKIIFHCFTCANSIDVYLLSSDKHNNYHIDKNVVRNLIIEIERLKDVSDETWTDTYSDDEIVPITSFKIYEKENKKLEKFLQIFKPDIKEIQLIKTQDRSIYHVRKLFVYKDYNVELEFESSGIKQLVKLFSYLSRCAKGHITFIDEIDTNINAVYLEKLISFFKKYGEGQLIFTTHNIETMNALKSQSKAIDVLGTNNKIDTWVAKGNKSPISDYISGTFPNSPMNIEDFDFINIFLGEDE